MNDPAVEQLNTAREAFLGLTERIRPELLRYCARMMGSTLEGEDVVQETLAHAFYELSQLRELPALRGWLFRIAHNRATNALVARSRRAADRPLDDAAELPALDADAEAALERIEAVDLAIDRFLELAPAQRACVILKDVLDYTLDEIADTLEVSVPAVKAALHRGRTRLAELAKKLTLAPRQHSPEVVRYAALFNANDWDGIRAMLAREAKVQLVGRAPPQSAEEIGYFSNYAKIAERWLAPTWMDGREVIAVRRQATDERPSHVVELRGMDGRIVLIRDFRYSSYVVDEATFTSVQ